MYPILHLVVVRWRRPSPNELFFMGGYLTLTMIVINTNTEYVLMLVNVQAFLRLVV